MQLLYQCHEHLDYEVDFLEALRQCEAGNFTAELEEAVAAVKAQSQIVDDLIPDLPAPPQP